MEMNDYSDFVQLLAKNKKDQVFYNSSPDHAAIVFSQIFRTATSEVKIFAGSMAGKISSRDIYISALDTFLKLPNTILKVILQDDTYIGKSRVFSVMDKYPNKVHFKTTDSKVIISGKTNNDIHFTVADDRMFRLETDTNQFYAECNFNDPEKAKVLSNVFDKIFNT